MRLLESPVFLIVSIVFFFSRPLSCPMDLEYFFLFIFQSYCQVKNSNPSRDGILLSPTGSLFQKVIGFPCVSSVENGTGSIRPKAEPLLLHTSSNI